MRWYRWLRSHGSSDPRSEELEGPPEWDDLSAALEWLQAYGKMPHPEFACFKDGVRDRIQVHVPQVGALVVLAIPADALPGSIRSENDIYVLAASRDGAAMHTYCNELPRGRYRVWAVVADIASVPVRLASRIAMLPPGRADRDALLEVLFWWHAHCAHVSAVAVDAVTPLVIDPVASLHSAS